MNRENDFKKLRLPKNQQVEGVNDLLVYKNNFFFFAEVTSLDGEVKCSLT
jgi:hypothetical protein